MQTCRRCPWPVVLPSGGWGRKYSLVAFQHLQYPQHTCSLGPQLAPLDVNQPCDASPLPYVVRYVPGQCCSPPNRPLTPKTSPPDQIRIKNPALFMSHRHYCHITHHSFTIQGLDLDPASIMPTPHLDHSANFIPAKRTPPSGFHGRMPSLSGTKGCFQSLTG
jgi:hypothetical protein